MCSRRIPLQKQFLVVVSYCISKVLIAMNKVQVENKVIFMNYFRKILGEIFCCFRTKVISRPSICHEKIVRFKIDFIATPTRPPQTDRQQNGTHLHPNRVNMLSIGDCRRPTVDEPFAIRFPVPSSCNRRRIRVDHLWRSMVIQWSRNVKWLGLVIVSSVK